jgi:hypothetical protein
MWKLFNTILLVKVEVVILKYVSPIHLLKSSVRRSKRSPARGDYISNLSAMPKRIQLS